MADEELKKLNAIQLSNNICKTTIIPFKKNNVRNFLTSVNAAIKACGEARLADVLEYAKTRVDNDVVVLATEFETFRDFEQTVLRQFKPTQDDMQIAHLIAFLQQSQNESVTDYGKKALDLKQKYVDALYVKYSANNKNLSLTRIKEAEDLVKRHFINGLKGFIKTNMRSEPSSLIEAVSMAEAAEGCKSLHLNF